MLFGIGEEYLRLLRLGFRVEGAALNFARSVWLERFVRSKFALVGSNGAYGLRWFCTGLAQVFLGLWAFRHEMPGQSYREAKPTVQGGSLEI